MISYIRGTLDSVMDNRIILDCGGIGYEIFMSPATISKLPSVGDETKIRTYMHVREDGVSLYGFISIEEINMFNLLIGVSGIGPKSAVGILAALSPSQIMLSVLADDSAALSKAPGVGKKTAQRMILELRDKIKSSSGISNGFGIESETAIERTGVSGIKQDAIDALVALGYGRSDSLKAVLETAEEGMPVEMVIKNALKKLVSI